MSDLKNSSALNEVESVFKKLGWSYERLEGGESGDSFLLVLPEMDCLAEIFSDGRFAFQFGVDMEEMRNQLTGDQTEDMADDELVRVARYHLKPIVDRYRASLLTQGFEEGTEATADHYAITFQTRIDLSKPEQAVHRMAQYLLIFEKPAP